MICKQPKFFIMNCVYCNTPQEAQGNFCPNCFKQIRCRHCSETLLKVAKICIVCGRPVENEQKIGTLNHVKFFESEKDRQFEATFTDATAQSVSESFGAFFTNRLHSKRQLATGTSFSSENSQQVETVDTENLEVSTPPVVLQEIKNENIPSLQQIKLQNLPNSEMDWILVYAFYASKFGTTEFTREGILQLYIETGRKTDSRRKNFSQNIRNAVQTNYIMAQNATDFTLLEKGKTKVFEIFSGTSTPKTTKKSNGKSNNSEKSKNLPNDITEIKTKRNKSGGSITYVDLKLSIDEQKLLTDFFNSKKPTSLLENVLVVMKWYKELKEMSEISTEEINYLLNMLSATSGNLNTALKNMITARYRWVTNLGNKKYQITTKGENYLLNNLPKH